MRIVFATLMVTLIFGSCCSRENCTVDGTQVKIYGFSGDVMDSIRVTAYVNGAIGDYPTDSFLYSGSPTSEGYYTIPYRTFVEDRDYTIELVQADKTFVITNIGSKEESCGSCNKQRTVYEQLEYYQVDGNIVRSDEIVLRK